jgi:hypothetical protein
MPAKAGVDWVRIEFLPGKYSHSVGKLSTCKRIALHCLRNFLGLSSLPFFASVSDQALIWGPEFESPCGRQNEIKLKDRRLAIARAK